MIQSPSSFPYQRYAALKRSVAQPLAALSGREGAMPQSAQRVADKVSLSFKGGSASKPVAPMDALFHLDQSNIHFSCFRSQVPLAGQMRQVVYEDLQRTDLLPKSSLKVASLKKPILFSRLIGVDEDRVGCIMYVPGSMGSYYPCPVYQSSSRGAWQTPDYVNHLIDKDKRWVIEYLGKGIGNRGKTETALSPVLQQFLSESRLKEPALRDHDSLPYVEVVSQVWAGITSNVPANSNYRDQYHYNRSVNLERLYKNCKIDSPELFPFPPSRIVLPAAALPNFKHAIMTYPLHNLIYGDFRGEVYPSWDGKLWWTYYIQDQTQRAWVAHAHAAHAKDGNIVETGLPAKLINIGSTLALAPYEYAAEFAESDDLPRLENTEYVDIWRLYTSKLPLNQAYYQAKRLQCPD